ncbi:hypothetical protein Q4485_05620 [Granulosicoccaceae sp. 1_MG-2023]|nr:hypothetical protein [Granulosicoccaceae sp. 1_MG-2023]
MMMIATPGRSGPPAAGTAGDKRGTHAPAVFVRPAGPADKRTLFHWRNDEATHAMSCHADPAAWADYQRWFLDCLNNGQRELSLCVAAARPALTLALARFAMSADGRRAEIALEMQPARTERYPGLATLQALLVDFRRRHPRLGGMDVRVPAGDAAALTLFELAGFITKGATGGALVHLVMPAQVRPGGFGRLA